MEESKIEFKKDVTEAAMDLLARLRLEKEGHQQSGDRYNKQYKTLSDDNPNKENSRIWAIGEWLQVELLSASIEKLTEDIKTQSFDY